MIEVLDEFADQSGEREIAAPSIQAVDASDARSRRGATVLLATARRSLVTWFRVALATAGLSLTVSPDGLHALMSAVRQPPELVFLDDDLPGVAADRVEQMLARDARTAGTRVVRVTSPPDYPEPGCEEDQDRSTGRPPANRA